MNITCFFQENLANTDWVAVSALLVAIISLVATIWISRKTIELTEEHNKKTVEPFLTGHYLNMSEDKNPDLRFQSYSIKNCGPGPAILSSLTYKYEDQTFTEIEPFLEKHLTMYAECHIRYFNLGESHILSSNETVELFNVSCRDEHHLRKLLAINEKLGIQITYKSIYKIEKHFQRGNIFKD